MGAGLDRKKKVRREIPFKRDSDEAWQDFTRTERQKPLGSTPQGASGLTTELFIIIIIIIVTRLPFLPVPSLADINGASATQPFRLSDQADIKE